MEIALVRARRAQGEIAPVMGLDENAVIPGLGGALHGVDDRDPLARHIQGI